MSNPLRARDWIHIMGLPVLGFVMNAPGEYAASFILMLIASACSLSFAYSLESRSNKQYLTLWAAAMALAFCIGLTSFLITFAGGVIVILYTIFKFKGIPVVGTGFNSIGFGLVFLLGASAAGALTLEVILFSVFAGIAVFPLQLIHEMVHKSEDSRKRLKTSAAALGRKGTEFVVYLSLAALAFWGFYMRIAIDLFLPALLFAAAVGGAVKFSGSYKKAREISRIVSILFGLAVLYLVLI